jgi:acetyl esterase/lipase
MMRMRTMLAAIAALLMPMAASAQDPDPVVAKPVIGIPLWPNGAPGSAARAAEKEIARDYWVRNIHNPSLLAFPADPRNANGAAVIVIPGGAHKFLVWENEGTRVAAALNRMGVSAFVLKYRLAREQGSTYAIEGEGADDTRRAVRWVRANAARYGIDPARVGAMGFSAGGELVSMIADNPVPAGRPVTDAIDRLSARPDFQILVFPGPLGIPGKAISAAPPAFIVAGSRDECCATPSVQLYEQLRRAGVSAELHMFADAGHAFNLDETDRLSVLGWPDMLHRWLSDGGWLSPRAPQAAARVPASGQ